MERFEEDVIRYYTINLSHTLLFLDSFTLDNIICDLMDLLRCCADSFIDCPALSGTIIGTVRNILGSALLNCLIDGLLLIGNGTDLPELLIAVLVLVGFIHSDIAGVAPLLVAVVAGHHLIVPGLLHHHHLLVTNAATAIRLALHSQLIDGYLGSCLLLLLFLDLHLSTMMSFVVLSPVMMATMDTAMLRSFKGKGANESPGLSRGKLLIIVVSLYYIKVNIQCDRLDLVRLTFLQQFLAHIPVGCI